MDKLDTQQTEKIYFLSPPTEYSMGNEWHEFAKQGHFWMKWRFNILQKIIPKDFIWGKTLEIGCGNDIVMSQIEKYYGCIVSGCDLNISALRNASSGRRRSLSLYIARIYREILGRPAYLIAYDSLGREKGGSTI